MPAYITITDPETDPEAPLTSELAKKWRDNPLAIAEGDAAAPRILDAALDTGAATAAGITWVGLRTAGLNTGDVGSYAMLQQISTTAQAPGATVAGSGLLYTNAAASGSATSPSGTWRLMGRIGGSGSAVVSLWLRIS